MSEPKSRGEFDAAFAAGEATVPLHQLPHKTSAPVVAVRAGYNLVPIAEYLDRPARVQQTVTLHQPASFSAYVNAFKDADTLITADLQAKSLTAILDYHKAGADEPRWGSHKAVYECRHTVEWNTWMAINKKPFDQADLAQFIEDNLPDIATPAGAVILEMTKTLEVKKNVEFSSAVRLDNGQVQAIYVEDVKGTSEKGSLQLVDRFTLALAPFEGSPKYALEARLRYRLADGQLMLWLDLVRPHKVIEDAFTQIVKGIETDVPGVRLVHGKVG
jgi:uncharacterized protein YfdQ (DUF2303 family)